MTIKRKYLNHSCGQTHVRTAGDKNNPILLLLHQTPSSGVMFEKLMKEMSEDFFLIAPDLPGFGMSDPAKRDTIESYAEVIWDSLSELTNNPIHIIGHHSGVAVAVEMAVTNPEHTISLALCGPTVMDDDLKAILPSKAEPFTPSTSGEHLIQMWNRIRSKDQNADLALTERETLLGLALEERYLSAYKAVVAYKIEESLKQIKCPCLVFAGTNDILHHAIEPTLSYIKNGKKAEVKNANGYIFDQNAQDVAILLKDYYEGI